MTSPQVEDEASVAPATGAASGTPWAAVVIAALVVFGTIGVLVVNASSDSRTVSYVIPAGTGDQLDRGETVSLLPETLTIGVGETLQIRNEDSRSHQIGIWLVRSGETLDQTFLRPQSLIGDCALNQSGHFQLVVVD